MYINGILPSYKMPVPVIVVGNISVGGTGKTPLLIGLCEHLIRQGFRPGVVSRGYGATNTDVHSVATDDEATTCGDEPLLIRRRTGCPVYIGKDRVEAAKRLLAENECDVILSDDGMQHYRLKRDIEIAVIDTQRKSGNGFCLPAGPLREPESRLRHVNMVVHHGSPENEYNFSLEFGEVYNLVTGETRKLESFANARVHAIAGIGHPARFFEQIRGSGLQVIEHAFPDHHQYTHEDIDFTDGLPVLMTEKDAVKCRNPARTVRYNPSGTNIWYVPVSAKISNRLINDLTELIKLC